MNERIRELEGDANDYADAHWERKCPQWHQFYTEKFAELIVRECADIGERYADGNYEVRNQIMAQFGLEEPEE
jgi:hypothetical protein